MVEFIPFFLLFVFFCGIPPRLPYSGRSRPCQRSAGGLAVVRQQDGFCALALGHFSCSMVHTALLLLLLSEVCFQLVVFFWDVAVMSSLVVFFWHDDFWFGSWPNTQWSWTFVSRLPLQLSVCHARCRFHEEEGSLVLGADRTLKFKFTVKV